MLTDILHVGSNLKPNHHRDCGLAINRRTLFAGVAACAMLGAAPAWAVVVEADAAEAFVQDLGDRVVGILSDSSLSEDQIVEGLATLIREGVNIPLVAQLAAGRYWRVAEEAQQASYLDLFEQYLIATYTRRFDQYSGESFTVLGSQPVGKEDMLVVTQIEGGGSAPAKVGWRLRDRGDGPKIIDVDFAGVTMLKTQRDEFAAVIERGGGKFDALISALEKQVQSASAS
ncbi:MAG: ABC transporter substrate-binding protein [Pseudomonadota bacterium]